MYKIIRTVLFVNLFFSGFLLLIQTLTVLQPHHIYDVKLFFRYFRIGNFYGKLPRDSSMIVENTIIILLTKLFKVNKHSKINFM